MLMPKETPKHATHKPALKPRPPIVVVMGHVDHGKTTLLDYIRKANVAGREAGGITQAVGAYEIVHTPAGATGAAATPRKLTFIDTPGHEAFSAMRSRGAQAADLAILVVAADDGVKLQTKEALKIIEESKTPFIVAINKIDKVGGNVDKARNELTAAGILLEGYGGQVSYHGVSAKTGEGVDELLDLVLLSTDVEELTYDPGAPASGFVLEARRDPRRGIEASVIVKNGTLRRGDMISTPSAGGKIKILENFLEKTVDALEPSAPALIIGFESIPKIGEIFTGGDAAAAGAGGGALGEKRVGEKESTRIGEAKSGALNLILKAGDAGSLEALAVVLKSVDREGGREVNIVEEGVGEITDGDIRHAIATNATIIGFKNRVSNSAKNLGEAQSVTVITSDIVYDLAKAVEDFLTGARGPAILGELEVLALFNQEKPEKQLVGGRVTNGIFRGKSNCEIFRTAGNANQHDVFGKGKVLGLRAGKDEITQAEKGKEIGVLISSNVVIQVGDKLLIRK